VINKADLVEPGEIGRLEGILRHLNPRARLLQASFGRLPLDQILNTGLFNFERAREAPGWLAEMRGEHVPETEEYGITSFVYRARRPFHPARFWGLIHEEWTGVIRSKGFFWLASRGEMVGLWSQAGGACRHGPAGQWWADSPREEWPEDPVRRAEIEASMERGFGDRRQEIVLIGADMDRDQMTFRLDDCLLTAEEMSLGSEVWRDLPDPFPRWDLMEEGDEEEGVEDRALEATAVAS